MPVAPSARPIDPTMLAEYQRDVAPDETGSPGKVDRKEVERLIATAGDLNKQSTKCCGLFGKGHAGDKSLEGLIAQFGQTFESEAKSVAQFWLKKHRLPTINDPSLRDPEHPFGKMIFDWKCEHETWHCHWFPWKATNPHGGDPQNNLYAPGGALQKYDRAFGRQSQNYELMHNAKPFDSGPQFAWFGECNHAAELTATLSRPLHGVNFNGQHFNVQDICGLLVKVIPSLISKVDYEGERYNGPRDDADDPSPQVFYEKVLLPWCKNDPHPVPFVMDITRTEQVWNYPYDQGRVFESKLPPPDVDPQSLLGVPDDKEVRFYRSELSGTGYPEQARHYEFWLQWDSEHKKITNSGWLAGSDEKINPDFAWKPHAKPNLMDRATWKTVLSEQNNPHVKAEDVYEIYMASLR